MTSRRPAVQVLGPLGLALLELSCGNEVLCDYNGYGSGVDQCAVSRYEVKVSIQSLENSQQTSDRTDIRNVSALPIRVNAQANDIGITYNLDKEVAPNVKSVADGTPLTDIQVVLDPADRHNVLVSRMPEQLQLGALQVAVTLPGLPTATSDGQHRVFRAPRLASKPPVEYMVNPHNNAAISARLAVQSAGLVGGKGQVLITEQGGPTTPPKRWLDLYEGSGTLGYSNDSTWLQTQKNLFEGAKAMLTLVKGAIVIYDIDAANVLPMVPLPPLSGTRLFSNDPMIPVNATALAGCSEESAVMIGLPGEVRVFQTNPGASMQPYTFIYSLKLQNQFVLAARDVLGAVPRVRSDAFFAAVWESNGKTTLLKLIKDSGKPIGVEPLVLPSGSGLSGARAGALADLDSDGLQDLIMASMTGELSWSPQRPDGSFLPAQPLGVSASGVTSISVGDINGDGLPDVLATTGALGVQVFLNQP